MIKIGDIVSVVAWGGETAEVVDETNNLWAIMTTRNIGVFKNVAYEIVWVPKNKEGEWYGKS